LVKNLRLPNDLAGASVDAQGLERLVLDPWLLRHGTGQEDLAVEQDRRRPALAGDRRFPGDVLGSAPFGRQVLAGVVSLAGGAAELGPIFGAGSKRRYGEDGNKQSKTKQH